MQAQTVHALTRHVLTWRLYLAVIILPLLTCQSVKSPPLEGSLRLMAGLNNSSGFVQVYHQGSWGLVCDEQWHQDAAQVACQQVGYETGKPQPGMVYEHTNPSSLLSILERLPIHISEVHCEGGERRLIDCSYVDAVDCEADDAAGVTCSGQWRDIADVTTGHWGIDADYTSEPKGRSGEDLREISGVYEGMRSSAGGLQTTQLPLVMWTVIYVVMCCSCSTVGL